MPVARANPAIPSLDWHSPWIDALMKAGRERRPVPIDPNLASCSLGEAYQIQAANVRSQLREIGGTVAGIKLGGCTEAALARLNLVGPFRGPIFSARMHQSAAVLRRSDFIVCIIEAEIGVKIGRDLGGGAEDPTRDDLLAAIDSVFPAIEIADSRLEDWMQAPAAAIVSDTGYAGAWIRGKDFAQWRNLDLVHLPVSLRRNGDVVREGSGTLVLGDPLRALGLLVSDLRSQGTMLRAGTLVSTGSCIVPFPTPNGGRFIADFGALGSISMELS